MKLKNKLIAGLVAGAAAFFVGLNQQVSAATINNDYALSASEGSPLRTNNNVIIAHATAVYAPARNVATYEKREWYNAGAYVQYIVGIVLAPKVIKHGVLAHGLMLMHQFRLNLHKRMTMQNSIKTM